MGTITDVHKKYVAEVTARWGQADVTHVTVMSVVDEHVCDVCRATAGKVIPIEDMLKHYATCESPDGCRCYFRPVVAE